MANTNSVIRPLVSSVQSGIQVLFDAIQVPYVYVPVFPSYSFSFALSPSGSPTITTTVTTLSGAPHTPTSYLDNAGPIQSARSTAPTTDDTTPGLNIGFVPGNQAPSLYVDGAKVASTYDIQAGTLTPANPLTEGTHVLSYTLSGSTITYTQTFEQNAITTQATGVAMESGQSGSL
jgi:hypothetical protein